MKPILFNTEMVRAILDGRKAVTRRVVKNISNRSTGIVPPECCISAEIAENMYGPCVNFSSKTGFYVGAAKMPYRPGDILYVRETWAAWSPTLGTMPKLFYKADGNAPQKIKWHPSIHMPKEAARIFLRVTGVRVERLQNGFPDNGAAALDYFAEGVAIPEECRTCIEAYGEPCCSDLDNDLPYDEITGEDSVGGSECGLLDEIRSEFMKLWDSTIKPADRPRYGWVADPWVWVIEFERIRREDGK